MNLLIFYSIFWLYNIAAAHGTEKHEKRRFGDPHYVARHHGHYRDNDKEENVTPKYEKLINDKALADYNSLNLMLNSAEKMLGFVNITEKVGFVFLHCKVGTTTLLLDSKSGNLIRFKSSKDIVLIKKKEFKGEISGTFEKILKNYEYKNESITGDSTEIDTSSEEGKQLIGDVYSHLGHPTADRRYRSFKFVSNLVNKLDGWYFGPLNGLLEGKGPLPLKQNLNRFFSVTLGLKKMFMRATGGLKTILKKVKFDINPIYNGKNGAEVFVYILRHTGAKFNLGTLWPNLLNDIGEILKIIKLLGGGESTNAVDETFNMIGHFWNFLSGHESLPTLVKFLLQASSEENWAKGEDNDFTNVVNDIKNITDEQSKKHDNSGLMTPFVTFFSNLTANSIVKNGVNVSDFVAKYRKRDVIGGLKFVTDVVIKLSSPHLYSNLLFDSFTAFLNSSSDPSALRRLMPGLSIDDLTSNKGDNLLEKLQNSYDIDGQLLKNANATEVLKKVPAFSELSNVYKQTFGQPLNFNGILNGQTMTHYLSKLITGPTKWTIDIVSNVLKDSGSFLKHILWDPFKPLIKGFDHIPQVVNIIPTSPKSDDLLDVLKTTKAACKDDCDEESKNIDEKTTKKSDEESSTKKKDDCDDCEKKESKTSTESEKELTIGTEKTNKSESTTEKECDDCSSKKTTEKECDDCGKKSTTEKSCDDCEKKSTTEKSCDDCEKKSTTEKGCDDCEKKSTTEKECDDCKKTTEKDQEFTLQYKHHKGEHYGVKHQIRHGHHARHQEARHHHQVKHHQKARKNPAHDMKHHSHVRKNGGHVREEKTLNKQQRVHSNV